MKTLTALTAVFLPLNLITGFFGMNFEHFPFLKNEEGLLLTEVFMLLLAIGLSVYFWLNSYLTIANTRTVKNK
jgi:magnesium transporter